MAKKQTSIKRLKNKQIGFVGLGTMGYAMAGWISKADFKVSVFNRNCKVSEKWIKEFDGTAHATPLDLAIHCDVIFICVGRDEDVLDVTSGSKGIFNSIKPGALVVDHTTTSAKLSRELERIADNLGCSFLDAPVSGGEKGAVDGKLAIMCGGSKESFMSVKPVMESYSSRISLMGPVGSGQLCKMVNQICIAGLIQSLSEGINFAINAGLKVDQVIEIISQGAAQSWQMDNRALTMSKNMFDFGFAVKWMRKDLDYAIEESIRNDSPLPITQKVLEYYLDLDNMGEGKLDTSSLIKRLSSN
jgi:3-hydroxyisobutyrate dehydrogenase